MAYTVIQRQLPDVATLKDVRLQIPMQIYSADGELIAQYGEINVVFRLRCINLRQMVKAFIATEDSRFYEHHGVDPWAFSGAEVWRCSPATRHKRPVPLPQQLARSFSVQNAR